MLSPPPMPCLIHGDMPELLPENEAAWRFYCEWIGQIERTENYSDGKHTMIHRRIDVLTLRTLLQVYHLRPERIFFDKIKILWETLHAG